MPRKQGWDYAQLKTDFLADPEFQDLARSAPSNAAFVQAVGLWAIGLARSWRTDDDAVEDAIAVYRLEESMALLRDVRLMQDGRLRGYHKWSADVRAIREADAERKRQGRANRPDTSDGVQRSPADTNGVRQRPAESAVGVVVGVVDENVVPRFQGPENARGTTRHGLQRAIGGDR